MPLVGCTDAAGDGGLCDGAACDDGNECTEDVCDPADGSCSNLKLADGSFCDAGYCQSGQCEPIASVFPCDEQGILDAIAAGGGPHGFECDGPTVVTTVAEIVIDNDVILDGRDNLTVDGNDDHHLFSVVPGVEAELRRFTATGGFSPGDLDGTAGGIANEGTLALMNSTVSGNSVGQAAAGGIWNGGIMTVSNSTVSRNSAGEVAFGGIWNVGTMALTNSTVSGNSVGAFGVNGILNDSGMLTVTNCTVSENSGGTFGGIWNDGTMALTNSTVSGNSGESSGGILNSREGTLTMTSSTVSGNTSESGASIVNVSDEFVTGVLMISNSVIDDDCIGWREGLPQGSPDIISSGYNIESPGNTCGFDQTGDQSDVTAEQLNLGELADNDGPTMTHKPGAGGFDDGSSVAIDAIPGDACDLTEDQRGQPRPETDGTMCDVGSVEVQP